MHQLQPGAARLLNDLHMHDKNVRLENALGGYVGKFVKEIFNLMQIFPLKFSFQVEFYALGGFRMFQGC
jgi:hypothetical protein